MPHAMIKLPNTHKLKYNPMFPWQYWNMMDGVRKIPVPIILLTISDIADNEFICFMDVILV